MRVVYSVKTYPPCYTIGVTVGRKQFEAVSPAFLRRWKLVAAVGASDTPTLRWYNLWARNVTACGRTLARLDVSLEIVLPCEPNAALQVDKIAGPWRSSGGFEVCIRL